MDDPRLTSLEQKIAASKEEAGMVPTAKAATSANEAANLRMGMKAGTEFVGSLIGGGLFGWGLDLWLKTGPAFLIGGLITGVAVAFWSLYKLTLPQPAKAAPNRLPTSGKADTSTSTHKRADD